MAAQPLSSSYQAYGDSFQTYLTKSTMREMIRKYSGVAASHIMKTAAYSAVNPEVFRVLGVGSGDGKPDMDILKAVASSLRSSHDGNKKPVIHACIVEPSSFLITDFKQGVSPLPHELGNLAEVSFEWQATTFQDFISSSLLSENKQYHMAHFICSLYYMDPEESLRNCFVQLANGGALFCLLAAEDSFFAKIAKQGKLKGLSFAHFYTGKDIVAIAERNNWRYEELPKVYYEVDITSCFDKTSQDGSLLLDFLTHQISFRETAEPALYNEMMDFISQCSLSDNEGRKILRPELAVVIIYK